MLRQYRSLVLRSRNTTKPNNTGKTQMMKTVIRAVLVAALAVGFVGVAQTVRAGDKKEHKATDKFQGEIEAVDLKAGTVTIKSKKESKTFVVNAETDLAGAGKATKLADLKVGDKVNVHFKPDSTPLTATKIGHIDLKPKKDKADGAH
jgi:Cu/Ag efflux protein CusF